MLFRSALMEQVELWLKSSESEIRMDLTLCKTGTPDTFKVRYDADRIGLLVLMLETDADLCDVAYSAMLKYFADMGDQEREASLREFATLCREIHRHMDLVKLKRAVDRVYDYRNTHQHLDLIAGLPYENYESFMRSFDDVYRMRPDQLQMGFLKVLKGSYIEEQVAAYDLKYRGIPPYEVLSTKWLPYSDVIRLKGVEDMVQVYYKIGRASCRERV